MSPREAAETILAARTAAKRMGHLFKPDFERLRQFGFSNDAITSIMSAVHAIEKQNEETLSSLNDAHR